MDVVRHQWRRLYLRWKIFDQHFRERWAVPQFCKLPKVGETVYRRHQLALSCIKAAQMGLCRYAIALLMEKGLLAFSKKKPLLQKPA